MIDHVDVLKRLRAYLAPEGQQALDALLRERDYAVALQTPLEGAVVQIAELEHLKAALAEERRQRAVLDAEVHALQNRVHNAELEAARASNMRAAWDTLSEEAKDAALEAAGRKRR